MNTHHVHQEISRNKTNTSKTQHIKTHQNNKHHLNNNKGLHFCFRGGSMGSKATGALLGCPDVTPWWRESNVGGFMGRGMDISVIYIIYESI